MSQLQLITDSVIQIDTGNAGGGLDTAPSTTTLAADITTTTQTSVTLASGTHALDSAYIQIGSERLLVLSGGGTVNLVVQRDPTTAATHATGATVTLPGIAILNLLSVAQAPNVELFVRKTSGDLNVVDVTTAGGNTFPGGGSVIRLADNDANGTLHLKFPGSGTTLLVLASGGSATGATGATGPAGPTATPPGNFTIGTVTAQWVPSNV